MKTNADKKDIKNFTLGELESEIVSLNQPKYRARQIFSWIYKKGISDFDKASDMPKDFISKLKQNYYINKLELSKHLKSEDLTEKFLFKLSDGNFIETVLIKTGKRETICISTQVGCKFACVFCASGKIGFKRDLTVSEIISQILFLRYELKRDITNYVFMGMGEPLDNCENLLKVINIMNLPQGMDIGARRITVSTSGIIPGIEQLKKSGLPINLSLSLHACNDKLRDELMPINKKYPLKKVLQACKDFAGTTSRIITLEYTLIHNKNDSLEDASELAKIAKRLRAKINLIPCSQIDKTTIMTAPAKNIDEFKKCLMEKGVNATIRESKGKDIQAACGQLAGMSCPRTESYEV